MLVTLFEIDTFFRLVQKMKALLPILITLFGIDTLVNPVEEKALSAIKNVPAKIE